MVQRPEPVTVQRASRQPALVLDSGRAQVLLEVGEQQVPAPEREQAQEQAQEREQARVPGLVRVRVRVRVRGASLLRKRGLLVPLG